MLHHEEVKEQNLIGQQFCEKKIVGSKNLKIFNTDRAMISKTNCLEKSLNDANPIFKIKKNAEMYLIQLRNTGCKTLRTQ